MTNVLKNLLSLYTALINSNRMYTFACESENPKLIKDALNSVTLWVKNSYGGSDMCYAEATLSLIQAFAVEYGVQLDNGLYWNSKVQDLNKVANDIANDWVRGISYHNDVLKWRAEIADTQPLKEEMLEKFGFEVYVEPEITQVVMCIG
jgi:hypothetical protein